MIDQYNDFTVRHFRWDDLPGVAALSNAVFEADSLPFRVTEDDVRQQISVPYFEPEQTILVAEAPDGSLAGYVFAYLPGDGRSDGFGHGMIHPDYRRQGLGALMVRLADAQMLDTATQVPPDQPVRIGRGTNDDNTGARALFEAEGYSIARYFFEMRCNLPESLGAPTLPDGFEFRPFDREAHTRPLYDTHVTAFQDHWNFHAAPFDVWTHLRFENNPFDPTLWVVAWAEDRIGGYSVGRSFGINQPDLGWIDLVGVHPDFRRRGLGLALLQESFRRLRAAGFTGAGLGVDADSPTGAVALYERAGMHVHERQVNYRKVLRGGAES